MPPKLPKRKSKKHAEGCICEKCFVKRGIPKIRPIHITVSKNDTETRNTVPPPIPTSSASDADLKLKKFPFCPSCTPRQLRGEIHGPGCRKCRRKWKRICDPNRRSHDANLLKRSEEIDQALCELFALPFYSCPIGYATRKYYGKFGVSQKKRACKNKPKSFVNRFSKILKIHKGPSGKYLCCRNRVDAVGDRKFLDAYNEVCEWRTRANAANSTTLFSVAERQGSSEQTGTNSIPGDMESGVSRSLTEDGSRRTDETQQVISQNIKREAADPEEKDTDNYEMGKNGDAIKIENEESKNIVRDYVVSPVKKMKHASRKRIRVPECSSSPSNELESEPNPKSSKKAKKLKTKGLPVYFYDKPLKSKSKQPRPGSDDSETDPEFIPTSDQEQESEDYESVASSCLSEDEEHSSIQIVSDAEKVERFYYPIMKPIVILATVAELAERQNAKKAADRAEKQQERDREDFESGVLDKLEFSRCPLTYAVDTISKELSWDKFPYGAKVLNRGRITRKDIQNPNGGNWLQIKRQFVLRHFKTTLSITPWKGQWYCCRNRVDKMKHTFKNFLSRYWNISA